MIAKVKQTDASSLQTKPGFAACNIFRKERKFRGNERKPT
jgi:hypothetical protein